MTVTEQEFWTGGHLYPVHDPEKCNECHKRSESLAERERLAAIFPDGQPECQWFAMCTNPATALVPHPILVKVPACDRCQAWIERMSR